MSTRDDPQPVPVDKQQFSAHVYAVGLTGRFTLPGKYLHELIAWLAQRVEEPKP